MRLWKPLWLAFALMLVAAACTAGSEAPVGESVLQPDDPVGVHVGSFAGREPAPDFPDGLDWINVERPLSLADLRGKVVLLDFWTYGCINCIHIIPDLERLESQYPDELVVIGVHSAKFDNESRTENIRDVVARYGLEHPVVNDKDFSMWREWGAQAWPTLVLVDPNGNIVGGHSGEGIYSIFQPVIDSLVEEFDAAGRIDRTPLELVLEQDSIRSSVLSFPGKVLADVDGGRLFVADTNHHRILVTDLKTGEILDVAGSGASGYADDEFSVAAFSQPQGMALSADGDTLYVADTGNHAIRAVHLVTRRVDTVLGTGRQATSYPPIPGIGPNVSLSSPWDVERVGSTLYIAMTGSHQIWAYDLVAASASWFAGNGRESTSNGPRLRAELAQPSAVAELPDGQVAFADSESSSIRVADPADDGVTAVLAGSDRDLFDFGDIDGFGDEARLQHPLGLDYGQGYLWVADTYNSKIKRLDPDTREIVTIAGGEQGWADGTGDSARFSEPGGVSYGAGRLYVADTNNHAVRVVDLDTGEVTTRVLFGIERFPSAMEDRIPTVDVGTITVAPGPGEVLVDVALPAGFKINDLAPTSIDWEGGGTVVPVESVSFVAPVFPVAVPVEFGDGPLTANLTVYYCSVGSESLCLVDQVRLEATVVTAADAPTTAVLGYEIADPGV